MGEPYSPPNRALILREYYHWRILSFYPLFFNYTYFVCFIIFGLYELNYWCIETIWYSEERTARKIYLIYKERFWSLYIFIEKLLMNFPIDDFAILIFQQCSNFQVKSSLLTPSISFWCNI